MKSLKIFLIISALIVSLVLPLVILAQAPAAPAAANPNDNLQTCPKIDPTTNKPMTLQGCQKWILKQAGGQEGGYGSDTEVTEADLANKVGQIVGMILSVFGIVFLCLVIYSGIQWMTAGGNEEKVTKARERIMRAAIGLGIIAMSWALTRFIVSTLQTQTTATPTGNACEQAGGRCVYQHSSDEAHPCSENYDIDHVSACANPPTDQEYPYHFCCKN
jgi:hypothetical protein